MNEKAKNKYRALSVITVIWALVTTLLIVSYAASEVALTVTNMQGFSFIATASDDIGSNITWSVSGQTVTGYAKGYKESCEDKARTTTLTITNNSGSDKQLKIIPSELVVSGGSIVIKGANDQQVASITSNSAAEYYLIDLAAGKSAKVELNSGGGSSSSVKFGFGVYDMSAADLNTTFTADGGGTITVNGTSNVTSQTYTNDVGTQYTVTAVPSSGYKFVAWYRKIGTGAEEYVTSETSYTFTPTVDMTIRAEFASPTTPLFKVGSRTFTDLNAADASATSGSNKEIILISDGTLPTGNYTVSKGNKLIIPYDDTGTYYTNNHNANWNAGLEKSGSSAATGPFRTLTMADGAKLTVNGHLYLPAKINAPAGGKTNAGSPTGQVPYIRMQGNSNITLNNGAFMYCYGFITGSGTVTVNNGATVYECFQIRDYRGGDGSTGIAHDIFPSSQYYIQNVEVPMTFAAGGVLKGVSAIYVSLAQVYMDDISIIGPSGSGSLFNSTGAVTKRYDGSADRLVVDIDGDASVGGIILTLGKGLIGNGIPVDSAKYILGINNNMTININSGNVSTSQRLAMQPGSVLNIAKGANVTIEKNLYLYDEDQWGDYTYAEAITDGIDHPDTAPKTESYNHAAIPVAFAPGREASATRTLADLVDAQINVNGTLTATSANIYTTSSGANITSSEGGGKVILVAGGEETTYQAYMAGDSSFSYASIPITSAQLKNANGNYVSTANDTTEETYTYIDGYWRCATDTCKDSACTECNAPSVAEVNGAEYSIFQHALNHGEEGVVTMLANTSEHATVGEDVRLNLQGHTIDALTIGSGGILRGMDTTTNAFGSDGSTGGTITKLTLDGGSVDEVYQYIQGDIKGKKYIAKKDGNSVSFHRFDLGIKDYTFYGYKNAEGKPTGAMTFTAAFKGDSGALAAMIDKGFQIGNHQTFASDRYNGTTATLVDLMNGEKKIGVTLSGTLSGFNLTDANGNPIGPGFAESFAVHALMEAAKIGQSGSSVYSDSDFDGSAYYDDAMTFEKALQVGYTLADEEMAQKIVDFAAENGMTVPAGEGGST